MNKPKGIKGLASVQTAQVMTVFNGSTWFEISHGKDRGIEFYRRAIVIDIAWQSPDGEMWSFSVARQAFVEWVQSGFQVACRDCSEQAIPDPPQPCGHVVFAGDKTRAHKLTTAIKMGLV